MRPFFFRYARARARAEYIPSAINLFLRQLCRPLPFLDRDRQVEWGIRKGMVAFRAGPPLVAFKNRTKAGNRRRPLRKRDREIRKRTKRKQGWDTSNGEGLLNETYGTERDVNRRTGS